MITTNFSDKYSRFDMNFVNTFSSLLDAITTVAEGIDRYFDGADMCMHFEDLSDGNRLSVTLSYDDVAEIHGYLEIGESAKDFGIFKLYWNDNYNKIATSKGLLFDKQWSFDEILEELSIICEALDTVSILAFDKEEK